MVLLSSRQLLLIRDLQFEYSGLLPKHHGQKLMVVDGTWVKDGQQETMVLTSLSEGHSTS